MEGHRAYRGLRVPDDAPFELKPSPGRGWGVFATRRIGPGATILKEEPLFVIRKPTPLIREQDIKQAVLQLPAGKRQQFLLLRDNASGTFASMQDAFAENSFDLASPDESGRVTRLPAQGLLLLLSRFNYSCVPNAKIPSFTGDALVAAIVAIRDIAAGEEITFCYSFDMQFRTRRERHEALRFVCECRGCLPGNLFRELSDARRRLYRGLTYLVNGRDALARGRQGPVSSIITDPQFVYHILIDFLREEEGLLDDLDEPRPRGLSRAVYLLAGAFQTVDNVAIAAQAMAQDTWWKRLDLVLKLYGRADAADGTVAEAMRM
ncbi:hypothetical protein C8A05DRAFT_48176 [Staphylotrichum tortipilum]|uniref:SET domain-containing protein n=1 Tax=Staphylotrichum tortipilum TaxID=2831512 RepID=A0AAN6RNK5_9PEZI|nr:hypothetical protein C8A05DRAFT_48176 [Staphylotrichum longicolle]